MTIETLQQLWTSYLDAFGDVTPAERERLLRQGVTDDIVFSNPTGEEGHGFGKLVEHVGQFQKKNPGGYFKSNKLFTHHGQLLSEWTMHKKDGSELATGHTYARFDEDGRLTHTAGFWKVG
jgi:hypothetical protein